ncbi:unnamed protein product, partial [Sphacelaria rigidula]
EQNRLRLLWHGMTYPDLIGQCPATPHCRRMKDLLQHMVGCTDETCQARCCVKSRYALRHDGRCRKNTCCMCGPVRPTIAALRRKQVSVAVER